MPEKEPPLIFGSTGCGHCRQAKGDLGKFNAQFVDCQTEVSLCDKEEVKLWPTIKYDGKVMLGWPSQGQGSSKNLMTELGLI